MTPPLPAPIWGIFCVAIDNFGDIGVCWRLARQLHAEHAVMVHLFVDDWDALARFLRRPLPASDASFHTQGVAVHRWQPGGMFSQAQCALLQGAACVVEAFGCELPRSLVMQMASANPPTPWINLEYLSAEPWAAECHLLTSPQTVPVARGGAVVVPQRFYFPGFTENTGGLIRERGLLAQHDAWQSMRHEERSQGFVSFAGSTGAPCDPGTLVLSFFGYEGRAITSLLSALEESPDPSLCLVPLGRCLRSVQSHFGLTDCPVPGDVLSRGSLRVLVLPFLSQPEYDRLLSVCDVNFVRGEDSFVRALWAANPLVWQLYPQEGNTHLTKMAAFWAVMRDEGGAHDSLQAFWRHWNLDEDCRDLWHHLRPQLPTLRVQARNWQQRLATNPDLTATLIQVARTHFPAPEAM